MPPSQLKLEERRPRDDTWSAERTSAWDASAALEAVYDLFAGVAERDADPSPAQKDALVGYKYSIAPVRTMILGTAGA